MKQWNGSINECVEEGFKKCMFYVINDKDVPGICM